MNNEGKKTYEENLVNLQEDIQKDAEEVNKTTEINLVAILSVFLWIEGFSKSASSIILCKTERVEF